MQDDYYEDRVRQEILAKGLVPGDLVGELPDPNVYPGGDVAQPIRALNQLSSSRPGGGSGVHFAGPSSSAIYRPGGPTTHFGSAGLGPFDDLHTSATTGARRAALLQTGVGEENWMWKTAMRVQEANDVFASMRRRALNTVGMDVGSEGVLEVHRAATRAAAISAEGEPEEVEGAAEGAYEPHSHLVHREFRSIQ